MVVELGSRSIFSFNSIEKMILRIIYFALVLAFVIPMSVDFIFIVRQNRMSVPEIEEQLTRNKDNRRRAARIIILFMLLPISMGILFFLHYLFFA